jgi:1-acyl-sn-glycerol-3-phosphate acyltransferase
MRLCLARGDLAAEREAIVKAAKSWSLGICRKLGVALTVEGETVLPDGPVLIVANHESYADIPIFFSAMPHKQFGFVAKDNLRKLPFYGKWIAEIHSVFLKRDDARSSLKTMEEAAALMGRGYSLAVFPEGTRSRGGPMGSFKKGSLRLATKSGTPIVPVTLKGSYHIFEETGFVQRNRAVRFYIHPPIETANLSKQEANALTERVERIIGGKLEEWGRS